MGLYSMEFRRMRGDLIERSRILRGLDRVDAERLLPLVGESKTRGYNLRVRGRSFKMEIRRNFFSEGSESVEFFTAEGCRGRVIKYVQG